jgi:hypothetical protein
MVPDWRPKSPPRFGPWSVACLFSEWRGKREWEREKGESKERRGWASESLKEKEDSSEPPWACDCSPALSRPVPLVLSKIHLSHSIVRIQLDRPVQEKEGHVTRKKAKRGREEEEERKKAIEVAEKERPNPTSFSSRSPACGLRPSRRRGTERTWS